MCNKTSNEPLTLIKWGDRFLWGLLFISFMVVMGYWHTIITFTFLGSIMSMFYIAVIWRNYVIEKQEIAKTNLHDMYSLFVSSREVFFGGDSDEKD